MPFLERLLYRPRDVACIRVLVITPTRELASQIHSVLLQLSQFTDISSCLICGGKKDIRSQEVTLRQRPDVRLYLSCYLSFSFELTSVSGLS